MMDGTKAALLVRDYFVGLNTTCPDLGFEVIDISRFGVEDFDVVCRVFTCPGCEIVGYRVVVRDGAVLLVNRLGVINDR